MIEHHHYYHISFEGLEQLKGFLERLVPPSRPPPRPARRPAYKRMPWETGVCQFCGAETMEGRDPGPKLCSSCNEELKGLTSLTEEEKAVERAIRFLSRFDLPLGEARTVSPIDVANLLNMNPARVAEVMETILKKQSQAHDQLRERKERQRRKYIE